MKILKARNGIALVAVLTIMLITSLFIPLMFNLADTSLYIAVKGTDRQKASYLARTVTEMSVAAFKKFDSIESGQLTSDQQYVKAGIDALLNGTDADGKIETTPVAMFSAMVPGVEYYKQNINKDTGNPEGIPKKISEADYIVYRQKLDDLGNDVKKAGYSLDSVSVDAKGNQLLVEKLYYVPNPPLDDQKTKKTCVISVPYIDNSDQNNPEIKETKIEVTYSGLKDGETYNYLSDVKYLGEATCTLTYEGGTKYYKTWIADHDGKKAGDVEELTKGQYNDQLRTYMSQIAQGTELAYEYSSVNAKNVYFETTATVNGVSSKRKCTLILQTYPTEENWFQFKPESGGNQIFVDPARATSVVPISYDRGGGEFKNYQRQSLLVYSSVGNMIISSGAVTEYQRDENGNFILDGEGNKIPKGDPQTTGKDNSNFVLGVEPGLNTTPNNDPNWSVIDGVNYNSNDEVAQMNNFVAFASTKAIRVDLPVNLMVNPCRANRIGDNPTKANASLYKIMLFQAPDIIFEGAVDMMMSFYVPSNNSDARRMSSVVLNAPSATPYHYPNKDRNKTVRAGRVFFLEDSYLWIIPYGDDGSASSWTGFLSETIYKRDSDFQKIKIANAGDVYYFNAEVTQTKNVVDKDGNPVDKDGVPGTDTVTDFVGFSLTGYFLETKYLPAYTEENTKSWWNVWNNAQAAIFGSYMEGQLEGATYMPDDFHYIGNINDGVSIIEYPEVDDYYVVWNN